jgi:hypothetical protein
MGSPIGFVEISTVSFLGNQKIRRNIASVSRTLNRQLE